MPILVPMLLLGLSAGAGGPVVVAGKMSDTDLLALSVACRSSGATLLISPEQHDRYTQHLLSALKPPNTIRVGEGGMSLPEAYCGLLLCSQPLVVCPAAPREQLLHAAALAASQDGILWVSDGSFVNTARLARWLRGTQVRKAFVVGKAPRLGKAFPKLQITHLSDARAVAVAYHKRLAERGPITAAVVCNPHDEKKGGMSLLAPWLAAKQRAALLLTDEKGDVARAVKQAEKSRALRRLDSLTLLATPEAIPVQTRANPIPADKDKIIEMEPLTPKGTAPCSYAVGRIFHKDRAVVPLLLARQELAARRTGKPRALVASNPGGGLPLLELFSRCSARELEHVGYSVEAMFRNSVEGKTLRKKMVGPDVVLWEGHHNTLIKDWGFPKWDEPMPPALVVLQSCLALKEEKVDKLLSRGAYAVVGTSTRTYSGSGGAFSLAYLGAMNYEGQSLGGSLRHAKNFLIACSLLKKKRLGTAEKLGANQRAAWAFTLWGDPTFVPPVPTPPAERVRHRVLKSSIVVTIPEKWHEALKTAKYRTEMPANGRLAGLVQRSDDKPAAVVPLVFLEVALPKCPADAEPRLSSKLPSSRWVFNWDARRKAGYLLALPRRGDRGELRFRVEWQRPGDRRASRGMRDEG
jgi:hypothetical protein